MKQITHYSATRIRGALIAIFSRPAAPYTYRDITKGMISWLSSGRGQECFLLSFLRRLYSPRNCCCRFHRFVPTSDYAPALCTAFRLRFRGGRQECEAEGGGENASGWADEASI